MQNEVDTRKRLWMNIWYLIDFKALFVEERISMDSDICKRDALQRFDGTTWK